MQGKEKKKYADSLGYLPTAHLSSLFLPTLLPFHGISHSCTFFYPFSRHQAFNDERQHRDLATLVS